MSNALVSRQASPSTAPVEMQAQTDALLTRAKIIAASPREMLPKHYQGNPGACLLAVDWAERNQVGILEALGQVAFVHGKPVVSAVMQRKLAARAGYSTRLVDGDEQSATVAVHGPDGAEVGRATYTIELAEELGIMKGSAVWKADPAHMLILRATTRALMYYGPADLGVVLVDETTPTDVDADSPPDPPVVAEAVDTTEPAQTPLDGLAAPTEDELKAALKAKNLSQAAALRAVADMDYTDVPTLAAVAANTDAAVDLADWIDQQ